MGVVILKTNAPPGRRPRQGDGQPHGVIVFMVTQEFFHVAVLHGEGRVDDFVRVRVHPHGHQGDGDVGVVGGLEVRVAMIIV